MDKITELQAIVRNLIRQSPSASLSLVDIEKRFRHEEGRQLKEVSQELGYSNVTAMLKDWEAFEVTGNGFSTTVAVEKDHISEMNRRKKSSQGNKNHNPERSRRSFNGKDPYAFSVCSENSFETSQSELLLSAIEKKQEPLRNRGQKIVTSVEKIIPESSRINNFDESFKIIILDAINPHRFWFALYNEYKINNELMKSMAKLYDEQGEQFKVTSRDLLKGLYVAAKFHNTWHRSVVLEVIDEDCIRVLYVDYGTASDVTIDDIRFMVEDHLMMPALAHRGVLAYVQPVTSTWDLKAIKYFKKATDMRKVDGKICKRNKNDSSYYMAIGIPSSRGGNLLLTQILLDKEYAKMDAEFMDKEKVNGEEMEFNDYEMGKLLEKKTVTVDPWLPVMKSKTSIRSDVSVVSKLSSNKAIGPVKPQKAKEKVNNPIQKSPDVTMKPTTSFINLSEREFVAKKVQVESVKRNQPRNRLEISRSDQASSSESGSVKSLKKLTKSSNSPGRVVEQEYKLFKTKAADAETFQIYINKIKSADEFFFFLRDEMFEIKDFMEMFNEKCQKSHPISDDITVGAEVVVYADENYCRGQVVEEGEENVFQILLIDYGETVSSAKHEIYKLQDDLKNRRPAVYKGKLMNVPEYLEFQNTETFSEAVKMRYIDVKVSLVEDKAVELMIIDA